MTRTNSGDRGFVVAIAQELQLLVAGRTCWSVVSTVRNQRTDRNGCGLLDLRPVPRDLLLPALPVGDQIFKYCIYGRQLTSKPQHLVYVKTDLVSCYLVNAAVQSSLILVKLIGLSA